MKKFFLLPALVIVVGMGFFVRERMVLSSYETDVREKTAQLTNAYVETAAAHVPPLQQFITPESGLQPYVDRLQTFEPVIAEEGDIARNAEALNDLQIAMRDFVNAARSNEELSAHPSYVALQTEIGERSSLREMINEYNAAARRWNDRRESRLGSVMANIMDVNMERLLYVRFDGETEKETIIGL